MINVGNKPVKDVKVGNQDVLEIWVGNEKVWDGNLNLLSLDINDWEIGCWTAQVGTTLSPNNTGSALFRIRPKQGVIPVPPNSRIRIRSNSPWIFIVRIVGPNNVIFRNPAQLHGSNFPDNNYEIQLSSNEVGIALSLSSLPQVETGTTLAIWEQRLKEREIVPELHVV